MQNVKPTLNSCIKRDNNQNIKKKTLRLDKIFWRVFILGETFRKKLLANYSFDT